MVPSNLYRILLVLFCQLVLLSVSGYAAPTRSSIVRRQNDGTISSPQTRTISEKISNGAGTFLQTCTIHMIPVTGSNGEDLVQEETSCDTLLLQRAVANTPCTSSTSVPNAGSSVISLTPPGGLIASPAVSPFVGGIPSQASSGSAVSTSSSNGSSVLPSTTVVGAAAAMSSSSTPFTPPGRKLQVLPIGLGIFAGISIIGIIVVVLVTYERTKHRRNFRKQKLAEAGAPMGYGGNSDQTQ